VENGLGRAGAEKSRRNGGSAAGAILGRITIPTEYSFFSIAAAVNAGVARAEPITTEEYFHQVC